MLSPQLSFLPNPLSDPFSVQTFDDMSAAGVEPNDYVLSALFAAASYASCTPAQLDRLFAALALLRRYGAEQPGGGVCLSVLAFGGCCGGGGGSCVSPVWDVHQKHRAAIRSSVAAASLVIDGVALLALAVRAALALRTTTCMRQC